ncbi:Ig-like domain-containing protein [Rhodococcus sp. IEGM 1408]|uniref:L,D-transpeptidase n=1 Tax=Rhodococcus sp. IEGM 1408 TaxID=3082220 RepID=UPI0029557485|nr:Ig-like domain-containing protein [Rhodococcus sp. IEGM 1408]MDV7999779.1 Ig-like domain-containing protein [Rhodococcus sp. IEGM 1408]
MSLSRSGTSARSAALVPLVLLAGLLALLLVATGCTIPVPSGSAGETTPVSAPSEAPAPATLQVTPADGATEVPVVDGVRAAVENGVITDVVLTNDAGKEIEGELSRDGSSWEPAVTLGYGRTYTLAVTYSGEAGGPKTDERSFTMADPQAIVTPSLVSSGGGALESGREYGVGIIVAAKFDQPVTDRDAVEKYMSVTTEPAVEGNWFWLNDSTAHWRPQDYYETGTKVRVELDTEGRNLGGGQWGGDDAEVDFTIGDRRMAIADDATKTVSVFHNQELVKTMPTSMGKGGYATYNGVDMHFWTQSGTYTVLDKASSVLMDSSTYGLPLSSGYRVTVADAVRISNDGIYFHALASTVWAQGNTNTSHGCLNLSPEDAAWYFEQAVAGDVVEVRGTGGPELEVWQNGDWSVPWSTWQQGSAN